MTSIAGDLSGHWRSGLPGAALGSAQAAEGCAGGQGRRPNAATRALQEVAVGLLNDHITHCVTAAACGSQAGADAQRGEVAATIRQVVRLSADVVTDLRRRVAADGCAGDQGPEHPGR